MGHTGALSTVHTEGTDNHSNRGHTVGHTGVVNYIQRAQTTRQTGVTHFGALSTVHTESTDNQTGSTQWGTLSKMPLWTLTIVLPPRNNFGTNLFTSLPLEENESWH